MNRVLFKPSLKRVQNMGCGLWARIGQEQGLLELFKQSVINDLASEDLAQLLPGFF